MLVNRGGDLILLDGSLIKYGFLKIDFHSLLYLFDWLSIKILNLKVYLSKRRFEKSLLLINKL